MCCVVVVNVKLIPINLEIFKKLFQIISPHQFSAPQPKRFSPVKRSALLVIVKGFDFISKELLISVMHHARFFMLSILTAGFAKVISAVLRR